jgi:type IV pilus assembly protein PilW
MVSLTIGLIIVIAAASAYLGAAGSSKITDAQSRMNEDAQAALSILTQQLRMSGNNPKQINRVDSGTPTLASMRNPVYLPTPSYAGFALLPATQTLSSFTLRGCDGKFTNVTSTSSLDNLNCGGGTTTLPDSIAISFEADKFNTVPTSAGIPADCLGNKLDIVTATLPTFVAGTVSNAAVTYTIADNRFFIGTSGTIKAPSLYCKGSGGAAQPLVENIEDMQFRYGTLSATATSTTATVAGYLDAYDVINDATLTLLASDALRWNKVLTVRICVVVRSENPVVSDSNSAKYRNCKGDLTDAPDLRLRRAYSTTVVLRNRVL